jgi:hypothetical protein
MSNKQCLNCSNDISSKRSIALYCSQKCQYLFKRNIKEKKCLNCGEDITNKPLATYCNRKCNYHYKMGNDVNVKVCRNDDCDNKLNDKNRKAIFCSKQCKGHQRHLDKMRSKVDIIKSTYRKCESIDCDNNISHMKVSTKYCTRSCGKKVRRLKYIENDNTYSFRAVIAGSIRTCFIRRKMPKILKTYDILGCSLEYFKIYIENQFEPWMNWNNRGRFNGELNYGWDLDHKIPSSTAATIDEIIKINHYTNFQPLCGYVNRIIKSDKLDYPKR